MNRSRDERSPSVLNNHGANEPRRYHRSQDDGGSFGRQTSHVRWRRPHTFLAAASLISLDETTNTEHIRSGIHNDQAWHCPLSSTAVVASLSSSMKSANPSVDVPSPT
jgi:hypothetical protein